MAAVLPLDATEPCEPRAALGRGEVHVWYAWTHRCKEPRRLEYFRSLLSIAERERLERFAFESLRHEYLLTRALCRTTLSRYVEVAPREWQFRTNSHGRPELDMSEPIGLSFNLSNTRSLVACVVAAECEVGVDVEELDRDSDTTALARRVFSTTEFRELCLTSDWQERRRRFFELWTLKEAYIKARGLGMSLPLDEFSFDLSGPEIAVSFHPGFGDSPRGWEFRLFRPSKRHMMALALRRPSHAECIVHVRQAVPGGEGP